MKYLANMTGVASWQSASAGPDDEQNLRDLRSRVRDVVATQNLVVLCGLGTSMCVLGAPGMQDLWDAVRKQTGDKFETVVQKVKYKKVGERDNIELLLSHCQLHQELEADEVVKDFIATAEDVILMACRFVKNDSDVKTHEAFLRKVARRSTRTPRAKLFTTNYDLCFETAASHIRFVAIDGFSHTEPQEFDGSFFGYDLVRRDDVGTPDYIENVFQLYKLHGSVDWERTGREVRKSSSPKATVMVYPRQSKFQMTYEQPFLEMMSRFQMSLRQPNTALLIIGFGFADQHLAEPILSSVKSNVGLKLLVVDPAVETLPALDPVRSLISAGDARLCLVDSTFHEFVSIIPDVVAMSEAETHDQRVRATK